MEKEKKIEELAEAIYKSGVAIEGTDIAFGLYDTDTHFHRMAAKLYDAGYGNVKEAVKEMAREIFEYIVQSGVINVAPDTIKMFFKERYGVTAFDEEGEE